MPELTIGRMAKLYGLHRSTLYEAVEKGRVTAGMNGKGQRVIDLSEMIRVYGEPPGQPQETRQNPTPNSATGQTPYPTPDSIALLTELVEINRQQADQMERMAERIESLEGALRRLPAPSPADTPAPVETTTPAGQNAQGEIRDERQPPRDFADLAARFEARTKH